MKLKQFALPNAGSGSNILNTGSISREFKRRLDSYFTHFGIVGSGNGYRTIEDQITAYIDYITDPTHHNPAAFPGNGWHNCGCAYDVARTGTDPDGSGHYPATMEADYLLAPTQQQLYKWGLCIPMWKGSTGYKENWHVQPIETLGIETDRQLWLDEDDLLDTPSGYRTLHVVVMPSSWTGVTLYMEGSDVGRCQEALHVTPVDKHYGTTSETAVKKMQTDHHLTVDGVVGSQSWVVIASILEPPPPQINFEELYDQEVVKNTQLSMQIDTLQTTISGQTKQISGLNDQIIAKNLQIVELNKYKAKCLELQTLLNWFLSAK
jgi:hypothetical protein